MFRRYFGRDFVIALLAVDVFPSKLWGLQVGRSQTKTHQKQRQTQEQPILELSKVIKAHP